MSLEDNLESIIERVVRRVVRQEIERQFDQPVNKKYIMELYGVSLGTVDGWMKRGLIHRINPEGSQPKFSRNEVMNVKKGKL